MLGTEPRQLRAQASVHVADGGTWPETRMGELASMCHVCAYMLVFPHRGCPWEGLSCGGREK